MITVMFAAARAGAQPAPVGQADEDEASISHEEALRSHAAMLGEALGLSVDQAELSLQQQLSSGPTKAALRELAPGRLAGVWSDHSASGYKVVAWFTGSEPIAGAESVLETSDVPVEIRFGAGHTQAELEVIRREVAARYGPGTFGGSDVAIQTGTVILYLLPGAVVDGEEASLQASLEAEFGAPFIVEVVVGTNDNASTYGGRWMSKSPFGWADVDCTTGFTVANYEGATGVATAGHCLDDHKYWTTPSLGYATTFVEEDNDAYRDLQWASVVGTEYPRFWNGSSYVSVIGEHPRLDQVGDFVCLTGNYSGSSCGQVTSNTYQPPYKCGEALNQWCGQSWMKLSPYLSFDPYCFSTDSGGPIYTGGVAYGLLKGFQSDEFCYYLAIDYLYDLQIYLLTE